MNSKNQLDESLKFVAKHYKQGIFNPDKTWPKITGKKSYSIIQPALLLRIASVAVVLVAVGLFYYHTNKSTTITAQNISTFAKLPDKSEITLQPGAKLSYDKSFNKSVRNVSMNGNISFSVAHNKQKPFIVHTQNTQIKVLGTVFDINSNHKITELKIISGKVRFAPDSVPVSFVCTKNMYAKYSADLKEIMINSPEWSCALSKNTNKIQFRNAPLNEVCNVLNQYYGTKITLSKQNEILKLTTTFQNKSISEAISIINLTLDIHLTNSL